MPVSHLAEEAGRCLCGRFAAMPKVSPLDQLRAP